MQAIFQEKCLEDKNYGVWSAATDNGREVPEQTLIECAKGLDCLLNRGFFKSG